MPYTTLSATRNSQLRVLTLVAVAFGVSLSLSAATVIEPPAATAPATQPATDDDLSWTHLDSWKLSLDPEVTESRKWKALPLAQVRTRADAGEAPACAELGIRYMYGLGVERDTTRGIALFRRGTKAGDAQSILWLAGCYATGRGVARDIPESQRLIHKAAETGSAVALASLSYLYQQSYFDRMVREGEDPLLLTRPNEEESRRLLMASLEKSSAMALYVIGSRCGRGEGIPTDFPAAVQWFQKGTDFGYSSSQLSLAGMYFGGKGVAKDDEKVVKLIRQAMEDDYEEAPIAMASLYMLGRGVAKDDAEASRLLLRVANLENARACSLLAGLLYHGAGVAKDLPAARAWYEKAALGHDGNAELMLGIMSYNGEGMPKDLDLAEKWLLLANRAEIPLAKRWLETVQAEQLRKPKANH